MADPSKQSIRNYYILVASMISLQVTTSTIYMVLPVFFKQYGITNTESGVLIAIGTFAGIISSFLAGKYCDSHGRKPVLLLGVALYALVFYLFAVIGKDYGSFLLLRFVEGLAFYMTPVAVTTMAADIFPSRQRGKAMALYTMASGIGQLVGPLGAGIFIDAANFFMYFIFCGAFVTVSALVILFFVKETLPIEVKEHIEKQKGTGWSISSIWGSMKGLGIAVAFFFAAVLVYRTGNTMVNPFFSIYLTEELNLTMTSTSYFFAVRAIMTLAFAPIAGWMADKWGRKPPFLLGMGILIGTMLGYKIVSSFEQVLVIRALESISNAIIMPTTRAFIADLLTPENRGFGNGLYNTVVDESSTMGSILGGWVYDGYGFGTVFLIGAVTAFIGLFIVWLKVPEPTKLPHNIGKKSEAPRLH